eukprot:4194769-Amphidinium_carterae.1
MSANSTGKERPRLLRHCGTNHKGCGDDVFNQAFLQQLRILRCNLDVTLTPFTTALRPLLCHVHFRSRPRLCAYSPMDEDNKTTMTRGMTTGVGYLYKNHPCTIHSEAVSASLYHSVFAHGHS